MGNFKYSHSLVTLLIILKQICHLSKLPLRYGIDFKILTFPYQVLSSKQPACLYAMSTSIGKPGQIRLVDSNCAVHTGLLKANAENRAFSIAA